MDTTLENLQERVGVLLADLTHLNYTSDLVTEGVRQAMGEYSLVTGSHETLAGLDGAEATSVPDMDCGIIVLGAAGFVAACKTLDRKEQFNLDEQSPGAVARLGERLLQRFDRLLGTVRSARLRAADVPGWGDGWSKIPV